MTMHLTISDELNRKFREVMAIKKPLNKGIIRKCTEEAIKDWILKNNEESDGLCLNIHRFQYPQLSKKSLQTRLKNVKVFKAV